MFVSEPIAMASEFVWLGRLFRKPQSTNVFSKSAGFFARHRRVAPFRREESLRQFIHVCVFFQVIFQFVRIRRVTSSWNTVSVWRRDRFSRV
jgi:hypothetical protein